MFLTDIPEENYVSPVGGAKWASELWMIVPRPTGQKTAIRVLNFDPQTGDPLGLVFQSAEDTPFILACNASQANDYMDKQVRLVYSQDHFVRTERKPKEQRPAEPAK